MLFEFCSTAIVVAAASPCVITPVAQPLGLGIPQKAQVPSPGQGHLAKDTHLLAQLETGPLSEVIDLLASRPSEV